MVFSNFNITFWKPNKSQIMFSNILINHYEFKKKNQSLCSEYIKSQFQ